MTWSRDNDTHHELIAIHVSLNCQLFTIAINVFSVAVSPCNAFHPPATVTVTRQSIPDSTCPAIRRKSATTTTEAQAHCAVRSDIHTSGLDGLCAHRSVMTTEFYQSPAAASMQPLPFLTSSSSIPGASPPVKTGTTEERHHSENTLRTVHHQHQHQHQQLPQLHQFPYPPQHEPRESQGQTSRVLSLHDFELVRTLGTGMWQAVADMSIWDAGDALEFVQPEQPR